MEELKNNKSKIYSRFKSLPLLSSEDEKKLSKIIKKTSLKNTFSKRKTVAFTSLFEMQKFDKAKSYQFEFFPKRGKVEANSILENESILGESLNDSIFSNNYEQFSYSFLSVINFESILEKAKTRVIMEENNVKKEDLYFSESKVFFKLVFNEGSGKEIDTSVYAINNIVVCPKKKYNYNKSPENNTYKNNSKTNNTSPSVTKIKLRHKEVNFFDGEINKIGKLETKESITNEKNEFNSNDSYLGKGETFTLFSKKNDSLNLINTEKIVTISSKQTHNNKVSTNIPYSHHRNYYIESLYYAKLKNKKLFEERLRKLVGEEINKMGESYEKLTKEEENHKVMSEHVKKLLTNKYSKLRNHGKSYNKIKNPSKNSSTIKNALMRNEYFIEYIREKKHKKYYFEKEKEIIRGGRISFNTKVEDSYGEFPKNFALFSVKKVEISIMLIQQFWRYYYSLRNFYAKRIQSIFRGFYIRKKIIHVSYIYFLMLNRLNNFEKIVSNKIVNTTLEHLKEYYKYLLNKKNIKTKVLFRRNFFKVYVKEYFSNYEENVFKGPKKISNPLRVLQPKEEIIKEFNVGDDYYFERLNSNKTENALNSYRKVLITSNILIPRKKEIVPAISIKKINFHNLLIVFKLQKILKIFLNNIKKFHSLPPIRKFKSITIPITKQIKSNLIDKMIKKINKIWKNSQLNYPKSIIPPFIIRKKIIYTISKSFLFQKMFITYFRKTVIKFILKALIKPIKELNNIPPFKVLKNLKFEYNSNCSKFIQLMWKSRIRKTYDEISQIYKYVIINKSKFQQVYFRKYILLNPVNHISKLQKLMRNYLYRKKKISRKFNCEGLIYIIKKTSNTLVNNYHKRIISLLRKCVIKKKILSVRKIEIKTRLVPSIFIKIIKTSLLQKKIISFKNTLTKKINERHLSLIARETQILNQIKLKRILARHIYMNNQNLAFYLLKWQSMIFKLIMLKSLISIQRKSRNLIQTVRKKKRVSSIVKIFNSHLAQYFAMFAKKSIKLFTSVLKIQKKLKEYKNIKKKLNISKLLKLYVERKYFNILKILRYYLEKWKKDRYVIKLKNFKNYIALSIKKDSLHLQEKVRSIDKFDENIKIISKNFLNVIISYTLKKFKINNEKANNFFEKIKYYQLFRMIKILHDSSIKVNKLILLYNCYFRRQFIEKFKDSFNLWKNNIKNQVKYINFQKNKENDIIRNTKTKILILLRKKLVSSFCKDLSEGGRRLRIIDLVFTIEAKMVGYLKRLFIKEFQSLYKKNEQLFKMKYLIKDLYKEMHLSYLKTKEDYDKMEKDYEAYQTTGETNLSYMNYYDSDEEKIKFKYFKRSNRKKKEKYKWWKEFQI